MFGCAEERVGADSAAIYMGASEGPPSPPR